MSLSHPDADIFALFKTWIAISGYRDQRRFLRDHPELLDPQHDITLAKITQENEHLERLLQVQKNKVR